MAAGVESSSPETATDAVVLDFPASSFSSPPRIPKRLRKRLLESKSPSTVEEIEAKLRHADLRRQQFYEKLSSKARPKPRSPTRSSSNDGDLGQRLEAKLQAAEQKRQSILANAQMRLARLDELRQAAKSGVEMRSKRERERLVSKVELRVQQAEANRLLILKAYRQRRATQRERSSQSLLRQMAWESKYKERVRAAIHQKRAAAERKRLLLLEAEKKRAHARVSQVRRVAKSVFHQRETERRRIRDQLENRLQKAKSQRAEYLSKRRRQRNSVQVNWNLMREQADFLSRKLARCWRQFLRSRRTTVDLAKDYESLNINGSSVKSMPFEQFARLIESPVTLRTVKSLLDRLENRFRVSMAVDKNDSVSLDNIDHLLKRVATPKKRATPRTSMRSREAKKVSVNGVARNPAKLSRYPVRIILCSYMILGHPDAVLSGQGEREVSLAKSAEEFIQQFELLIRIILDGPIQSSDEESDSMLPKRCTFRSQLAAFDKAFCSYLNCFVVWKVKDARSLEDDLVRAACQLELSMIQKCKMTPGGDNDALTHDMKAIQKQVMEDQKLFREKIQHLSGDAGIERMECALSETRTKYFETTENGSTVGSPPVIHLFSPSTSSPPASPPVASSIDRDETMNGTKRPSCVVRSLFKEDNPSSSVKGLSSPADISDHFDGQLGSSVEKLATENELIVNEFLHEPDLSFIDRLSTDEENSIKVKIRETMETAFWDTVMEAIKKEEPSYDLVVDLVREVRDGITEMAPKSWQQEIAEAIDLDILSQVLKSGSLDIDYLGKILDFALRTLQKLSSPAQEEELKVTHQNLLKDLAETCQTRDEVKYSHAIAMIKGLRFVLEQIQALKQEISKARIKMMEPLLKGPAGLDYLRKAFTSRYGSYSDACTRLPLTKQWLSTVRSCIDREWEEHTNCLSGLMNHEGPPQMSLPSTALRTGGNFMAKTTGGVASTSVTSDLGGKKTEPGCNGDRIDLFVRLGSLKLSVLTQEAFPETLVLNMPRLRAAQARIQKIVVISTSLLVCRQALVMERAVSSIVDLEAIISKCSQQLLALLDQLDEVGIEAIVDIISLFDQTIDSEKLELRKQVMSRMLGKSLQAGDPIFEKVTLAVYLAARGVVLGGSGVQGRKLAEMAMKQVGAVTLTERLVETAEVLAVAASVSVSVHGPWYANLIDGI